MTCDSLPDAGCPAPQIQNGRIVSPPSSAYAHNDTVAFECDPGYVLRGHRVVQCQLNDTWEPPMPFCEQGKWSHTSLSINLPL
ncbi:CR2 protein, partial [Piaya cayana]|nr:CR2 protein [Piaya cayana]